MARKKQYIESEVIEKAMHLFWQKGYESTSVRMLEKEMGINQFSMYSSFGSKQGVFLESVKCYKSKLQCIVDKLKADPNGIEGVKEYFYDFIRFSKEKEDAKGCLIVSTISEFGKDLDPIVMSEIVIFTDKLKEIFKEKLAFDKQKNARKIAKQANYLMISLKGLAVASKVSSQNDMEDFIEATFEKL